MIINSIQPNQISQGIYRQGDRPEYKNDDKSVSSGTNTLVNETISPEVQARTIISHIDYFKEQLDAILINYPPYFPPGTFQRVDLIKGIKKIQEEVEKSSISPDIKREIKDQKISEHATDAEIGTAIKGLINLKNKIYQNLPAVSGNTEPGTILDIKI